VDVVDGGGTVAPDVVHDAELEKAEGFHGPGARRSAGKMSCRTPGLAGGGLGVQGRDLGAGRGVGGAKRVRRTDADVAVRGIASRLTIGEVGCSGLCVQRPKGFSRTFYYHHDDTPLNDLPA
jgi:hypothetical protein